MLFDSLQLVSDKASRPLTEQRDGFTLGEGAGILILENKSRTPNDFEIAKIITEADLKSVNDTFYEEYKSKLSDKNLKKIYWRYIWEN